MNQQVDYKRYLASREWRVKRKEVIEINNGVCERCASRPIQDIHHLTYERVGQERISDLMGVCRPCHEYLAAERDDDPALIVIKKLISEYGLCPVDPWPDNSSFPIFTCGGLQDGQRLMVTLHTEADHHIIQEFYQDYPMAFICHGIIALFSWCSDE